MIWDGIKLGFAMPLSWPYISANTHKSLMAMDRPNIVYLDSGRSGDIAEKRTVQVQEARKVGCTHIVFLDADMIYPPPTLKDLFDTLNNSDADMVGGLCYKGYEPYSPLIWHPTEDRLLVPFVDYNFGDIVDAGATGAACLLIKIGVFDKVEEPWFQFQREERTANGKIFNIRRGEDIYFSRKATRKGLKLKINTAYDIGHIRETVVDRHFWMFYSIMSELGDWSTIMKLYKRLKDKEWVDQEIRSLK